MSLTTDDREVDEETPFLPRRDDFSPARTPLPIAQISILLTAWLAECITAQSIIPYINQVSHVLQSCLSVTNVDHPLSAGKSAPGCRW
jgi:hypothetical protein